MQFMINKKSIIGPSTTLLFTSIYHIPCSLGYQSLVVPIHHPFHHPNRLVSWLLGQGYVLVFPSPLACYPLGHQFSLSHPSHQVC